MFAMVGSAGGARHQVFHRLGGPGFGLSGSMTRVLFLRYTGGVSMDATLLDAEAEAAVLRVYRQVFAVLAREAGAMIVDPELLDVDQAILDAFAEAGSDGLTVEQATLACRAYPHEVIVRRFEVLRQYGAITKLVDRPNELRHRAAFAPYVMLMFLRRMSVQGGQGELHQLLTLEAHSVSDPS